MTSDFITQNRNITVRLATSADIPSIMSLEQDASTASHWSQARYEEIFGAQAAARCSDDAITSRFGLVIEDDPGIQGFLVARQIDSELEIENMVVSSSSRRRGLGTRLLEKLLALARMRGAKAVFLEVRELNLAACSLYEKCDFKKAGIRPAYYRDPEEAAILYRLDLM